VSPSARFSDVLIGAIFMTSVSVTVAKNMDRDYETTVSSMPAWSNLANCSAGTGRLK